MSRRRSNACSACHRRKIKCDVMAQRPCTNCRLFGTVCQLHADERRKRSTSDHTYITGDNAENTAHQRLKILLADGGLFGMDYLKELIKRKDDLKEVVFHSHKKNFECTSMYYFPSSSHYQIYAPNPTQIHTYVDPCQYMKNMTALQLPDTNVTVWEILMLEGALLLPKKSICRELIDDFFKYNHWIFPFINKKEFIEQFEESKCSMLLLQCIIRCAIISSDDPRFLDDLQSIHLASEIMSKRIKCLLNYSYETDPLVRIQGLLLQTKGESLSTNELVIEESLFFAANLINSFGFHRANLDSDPFPQKDKKLCYWYFYIMSNAYLNGNIFEMDVDVEMLTLDDFSEDMPYQEKYVFIKLVELSGILKSIKKLNYSPKTEFTIDSTENIMNFTSVIDKWKSTLPPFFIECLETNGILEKEDSRLFIYVHLLYCKVILYLHKKVWLYGSVNDKQYSLSTPICYSTINMILDICDAIVGSEYLRRRMHEIFNRIILEAFQVVNYKYHTDSDLITKDACFSYVVRFQKYFEATKSHWLTAKIGGEVLKSYFPSAVGQFRPLSSLDDHEVYDFQF